MSQLNYSYSGNYPEELPDYWKNGDEIKNLQELSNEELQILGWYGPIDMPTNFYEYTYEWNPNTLSFDSIELEHYQKRMNIDYNAFWRSFVRSNAYLKIKSEASKNLEMNVLVTEFISLISDAKNKKPDEILIQNCINEIILKMSLSPEDFLEVQEIFINSGMFTVYTLA